MSENRIRKLDSGAVPSPARAPYGPASAGIEWDIAEEGLVVNPDGDLRVLPANRSYGKTYYVAAIAGVGDDDNAGRSWTKPFLTMAAAFAVVESGDTVRFRGNVREQISTPAGKFDVTVIGDANRPRHADAHTGNGGYSGSTWKLPASGVVATTPLVKVRQQGWRFINILFAGPAQAACIQFFRDGGASDAEDDGSHGEVLGCRFNGNSTGGTSYGVESHGGVANLRIEGNRFQQFSANANDAAIKETTGAGIGTPWGWEIIANDFLANKRDIIGALSNAKILWNTFHLTGLGVTNVVAIDTTGGAAPNVVAKNFMTAASNHAGVNARFVLGPTDSYAGNFWSDVEEYAEPAS